MSRSDREMLELAAKAAGMWGDFEQDDHCTPLFYESEGLRLAWGLGWWNPLTDDGDALRLAVKLGIRLVEFLDTVVPSRAVAWWASNGAACSLWEPEGNDPYAATRRAIVRAAAEIGASK